MFPIVICPFIYRYIPAAPTYDVYVLELVFPIMIFLMDGC